MSALLPGQGEFVLHFRIAGDPEDMLCVFGFYPGAPWDSVNTAVAHSAYDAMTAHIIEFIVDDYVISGLDMRINDAGDVYTATWLENTPGNVEETPVPQNVAYLIHKRSEGTGAGKNGRSYIPGVSQDRVSPTGQLDEAWADSIGDAMTGLLDDFDDASLPALYINRGLRVDPTDPPPRVPSVEPDPLAWQIETIDCDLRVATQRRRLRP